jgi:hypothetical protein
MNGEGRSSKQGQTPPEAMDDTAAAIQENLDQAWENRDERHASVLEPVYAPASSREAVSSVPS